MDAIERYLHSARRMTDRQLIAQNTTMREILGYAPRNIEEEMARIIAQDCGNPNWRSMIDAARIIWKRQQLNKRLL